MKKLYIVLILLLTVFLVTGQNETWLRISPKPIESSLNEISQIPGTNRIVAIGSGASIMYSDDMGDNWHIMYKPASISRFITLNAIHFVNQNVGYIVGSKSTILKTVDGGANWLDISPEGVYNILDVCFITETTGIITREESIWRTVDGGITWDSVSADGNLSNPAQLHFTNDSVGYLVNEWSSEYFKTNDKGITWQSTGVVTTIEDFVLTAILFLNTDTGFISGSADFDKYILKTIDGGLSWNIVNEHNFIGSHCIYFINDSIGISVGQEFYSDSFLRTIDGGDNWDEVMPACGALHLVSFTFIDSIGFCVGSRGFINRSTNWGLSWECLKESEVFAGSINVSEILVDSSIIIGTTGYGGGIPTGRAYKSIDRGESWTKVFSGSPVIDMQFLNSSIGYLICSDLFSKIHITTDGGNDWLGHTIDPDWDFLTECVCFINEDIGFVGGEESGHMQIYKTIDAGINWYPTLGYPEIWDYPTDIKFINDSIGFAVGAEYPYPTILKTYDQGETWESDSLDFNTRINKIEFVNDSTGFMIGYPSTILKTVDYGINWYEVEIGLDWNIEFTDVFFPTPQTGYITGSGNETTLLKTTDSGETWFPLDFPCTSTATCLSFFNEDEGFIMGEKGFIFKTYTGGIVEIPEFPTEINPLPILECFPNPTDDFLKIKINNTENNNPDRIMIYNSHGVLHSSFKLTKYQNLATISVLGLQNGIYYISALKDNEVLGVNKIIIVR